MFITGCIWLLSLIVVVFPAVASENKHVPEANNTVPILGLMSGYNSCPSRWYGNIHDTNMGKVNKKLIQQIERETDVSSIEYVVSCFPRSSKNIRFVSSAYSRDTYYTGQVETIVAEITHLARLHENHKVYLAGHSYGGWLAMFVVTQLPSWVNVEILATIDSISTTNCRPGAFVRSYLRSSFQLTPADGCTEAPSDLSHSEIKHRVDHWFNYYQSMYPILHSGYVGHADSNDMFDYDVDFNLAFEAHLLIENDNRVWTPFNRAVVKDILEN